VKRGGRSHGLANRQFELDATHGLDERDDRGREARTGVARQSRFQNGADFVLDRSAVAASARLQCPRGVFVNISNHEAGHEQIVTVLERWLKSPIFGCRCSAKIDGYQLCGKARSLMSPPASA
jgi:hypothetical protein